MERILREIIRRYALSIWHWIPFLASIFIGISMLYPVENGMITDFAMRYRVDLDTTRLMAMVMMFFGAFWLYTHRNSWGFFFGTIPLMLYSLGYIGWSRHLRNPAEAVFAMYAFAMTAKTFLMIQNGKITDHE